MGDSKKKNEKSNIRKLTPSTSPESQENKMISLAMNVAEEQLRNGTASSQVITHFLKLGSSKMKLEQEKIKKERELIEAKTENLQTAKRIEELYSNALEAMQNYSGNVTRTGEEIDE